MKQRLLICASALIMLFKVPQGRADDILVTLDLRNNHAITPLDGGTWQLFARRVETGTDPQAILASLASGR